MSIDLAARASSPALDVEVVRDLRETRCSERKAEALVHVAPNIAMRTVGERCV
jgi:hypothetical protein